MRCQLQGTSPTQVFPQTHQKLLAKQKLSQNLTHIVRAQQLHLQSTMNSLTRTLAKTAISRYSTRCLALRSFSTSTSSKPSTKSSDDSIVSASLTSKQWPRPSTIPFQSKVANSVSLCGHIHMPLQFDSASDGKFWAGTVISLNPSADSPPLWIPIIFEGDLAHIAVCHLKEDDHVYIDGQLSAGSPSSNSTPVQAHVQVMVRNINFVDKSLPMTKSHSASSLKGTETAEITWRDLLDNPKEWLDFREKKLNRLVSPKYPDFKHKDGDLALWLNNAPKWVLSDLEGLQFGVSSQQPKQLNQQKGYELWKDLVENPSKWWDNRLDKVNGKLKEKYPDFKHKDTGKGLWLSDSPAWVESKLPPLKSKRWSSNEGEK